MSIGSILIRADASVSMGTGHVMRCLALAQAWQDQGGEAIFAMAQWTPGILKRLQDAGFHVESVNAGTGSNEDAGRISELSEKQRAKWVVLDGYAFGRDFQRAVKASGVKLLFVDDSGSPDLLAADLVLNQNLHAREALYPNRSGNTELLAGPKYALVRREFASGKTQLRDIPSLATRILVTMGGSDPQNLTRRVMTALQQLRVSGMEVKVVVGGGNPRLEELKSLAQEHIQFEHDTRGMAELMLWADLAIAAAGSACWELCRLGLPAIVIDAATNQIPVARELHVRGIAHHIPCGEARIDRIAEEANRLMRSPKERSAMSRRGSELVDGKGALRVVAAMKSRDFAVRRAEHRDSRLLWEWANDPLVRQASFSPAPISWNEHSLWFAEKLRDAREMMLICEDAAHDPIGTVRFHAASSYDVEVGITVAPRHRGQNYGAHALSLAVRYFLERKPSARVHAFIKKGNAASVRSFEKVGFTHAGDELIRGNEALHYVLDSTPRDYEPKAAVVPMISEPLPCK